LRRFAVLNDPCYNEIEVVVEKLNGRFCFTHRWSELNSLYNLKYGGAITLINVMPSRFVIQVKDRYGEEIPYPTTTPPLCLKLNPDMFPEQMGSESLLNICHMPYSHEVGNFRWSYAKFLIKEDVVSGTLVRIYMSIT